jgi:hypothetical protein
MKRSIETNDIVLAACLRVKGYPLDRLDRVGNRGVFCFSGVADSDITDYDLGKALVEPVAFNNAIKTLAVACKRLNN